MEMQGRSSIVTVLIFLPVLHNPDASGRRPPVDPQLLELTAEEVAREFGGGTLFDFADRPPLGYWWDHNVVSKDALRILEVDVEDSNTNRDRIRDYLRGILLARFRQKAIYVKFIVGVDRLVITDETISE